VSASDPRPDLVGGGPHDYFTDGKPPSRGQNADVARLAAWLFDIPYETRYGASVFQVRLRAALEDVAAGAEAPRLKEEW